MSQARIETWCSATQRAPSLDSPPPASCSVSGPPSMWPAAASNRSRPMSRQRASPGSTDEPGGGQGRVDVRAVDGAVRPPRAAVVRDVHVERAGDEPVGREHVDRALLRVRHRAPAVERAVDGHVVERVEVSVLQAVRVQHEVVLPPAHAVVGRVVPGLVQEAGTLRRAVVVTAAQRAGQADGISRPDARRRPRPRGGVDEVGGTAPVAGAEGPGRGERPDPVRRVSAPELSHCSIV